MLNLIFLKFGKVQRFETLHTVSNVNKNKFQIKILEEIPLFAFEFLILSNSDCF